MRRVIFGLALAPLVAFSSVPSVGAQEGLPKVQPTQAPKKSKKQISNKRISKAPSSSLNSAEAYAVEHSNDLPTSSSSKPMALPDSPAAHSWTGFHVGAGVGAASSRNP